MKYIIDTNTLIYFLDGVLTSNGLAFMLSALKNKECALSVISEIEVLGFQFPEEIQEKKAEKFIASLPVIPLSEDIVHKTIDIRKSKKIKVADSIIAATAILKGATLVSRNEKDFKGLVGLSFLNPFDL